MNPNRDEPLPYTIPDAAAALRMSRTKLYELLDSGAVESVYIGRRPLGFRGFRRPDVAIWLFGEVESAWAQACLTARISASVGLSGALAVNRAAMMRRRSLADMSAKADSVFDVYQGWRSRHHWSAVAHASASVR